MAIKKVTKFVFPVGSDTLSQNNYYRALSEAKTGFYPFGENGLWHGGIHIDEAVLRQLHCHDKQMNCIANGEVVAYRMNEVYPKISYGPPEIQFSLLGDEAVAYFSSGFTLVRHYFQMPKIAGEADSPPSLTLYSVYMHQLDWYGYQQYENDNPSNPLAPMPFWPVYSGKVSDTTKESIKGSAIRLNGSSTEIVGLLLKGSKIKLGDEIVRQDNKKRRISRGWYKLESLEAGCIVTAEEVHYQLGSLSGYVYAPELNEEIEQDSEAHKAKVYSIKVDGNAKVGQPESKVPGIIVYQEANDKKVLGYLPKDVEIEFDFDGQDNGYAKIVKIKGNYIPPSLCVAQDAAVADNPTHQGWVKLASLSSLKYRPKAFDEVIVLDKPVAVNAGDCIGYLGHNVSLSDKFPQREPFALASMKRANDDKLSVLGHSELFTCDDLPAFISQTRALADKLPESEKTLILVEPAAQLINERAAEGRLAIGTLIRTLAGAAPSYYVQVQVDYVLTLPRYQVDPKNVVITQSLPHADPLPHAEPIMTYRLTAENKKALVRRCFALHPELTESNIPDKVELIGYSGRFTTPTLPKLSELDNVIPKNLFDGQNSMLDKHDSVQVRFSRQDYPRYWVRADNLLDKQGDNIKMSYPIPYWLEFPLSLDNLPKAAIDNTVHYARALSLSAVQVENLTATDANDNLWAYIAAGNKKGLQIRGWVTLAKGEEGYLQPHIRSASPWEWEGFESIEETAGTGEIVEKVRANRKLSLDFADYTTGMTALHHILTQTPMHTTLSKKGRIPPFTETYLKKGLRTPWTAEQIGRLAVKYESEWYADESLSKWNEIDEFYAKEYAAEQQKIKENLSKLDDTIPYAKDFIERIALKQAEASYKRRCDEWQIEKAQRIKPSLWWQEVAAAQAAQPSQSQNTETPVLTNLSQDGKAWYLHPVGVLGVTLNKNYEQTETWDSITNIRISFLHPKIRQASINFINDVEVELGIQLRIVQGYRTIDEQNDLYAQGRTLPGKKVTWVKGGYSYHNYGLAIDVVEIKEHRANWDENVLIKVAPIGKRHGFLWGGDWIKTKDYPHFEINFGYKTSVLLEKYRNGELENESYIKID